MQLYKIKGGQPSRVVQQLVAVSSSSESKVFVIAGRPLAVEIHCPAMHLEEVEGHVGGCVDLECLEVSTAVDVVFEAQFVYLLLPAQTVDSFFWNSSGEVFDLSYEFNKVSDRCLGCLGQHVSHEHHDFVGSWGIEAVLNHVGPFELVLSKQALEDMLDDFVISRSKRLLRCSLWLGGELSRLQGQRGEVVRGSHQKQDCSSGQDMTLHRDYQSQSHHQPYYLSSSSTNHFPLSPPHQFAWKAAAVLNILIINCKVEVMILTSKQCLIISSQQNRQFFLFDPKTTAVLHKYRDDCFLSSLAYYPRSQQILGQQVNKTFVNVWSYDSQEAELRVSMNETMTSLLVSEDNHYLIGGGVTGNLYVWELPNGILIKKKMVHSTEVKHVLQYQNHHVITASKNEVKIWPLSSFFIEVDHSSALKTYTSVLDIVSVGHARNILAVLTHKSVSFLQLSLQNTTKELVLIHKIDYQYVTSLCLSNTSAFIGDAKGTIQVIELISSQDERSDLSFKIKQGTRQLQISKPKRKRVLTGGSKHPITTLAYVQTLSYLIAGHTSGEVVVWSNHQIKKSLHLFKTSITHIKVVLKPKEQKIHQTSKLQPLNKYELSKEQELLDIVPSYSYDSDLLQPPVAPSAFENAYEAEEQKILHNMLSILNEPQKLLREQVLRLKQQRRLLLQSNLHYFNLLSE